MTSEDNIQDEDGYNPASNMGLIIGGRVVSSTMGRMSPDLPDHETAMRTLQRLPSDRLGQATDRYGDQRLYVDLRNMTPESIKKYGSALEALGIDFKNTKTSLNGGMRVFSIGNPEHMEKASDAIRGYYVEPSKNSFFGEIRDSFGAKADGNKKKQKKEKKKNKNKKKKKK